MGDQTFRELRGSLLDSGVASRHVRRLVCELHDHLDDLRAEALADGCDNAAANARALSNLGDQRQLARRVLEQPQLRPIPTSRPPVFRSSRWIAGSVLLPFQVKAAAQSS